MLVDFRYFYNLHFYCSLINPSNPMYLEWFSPFSNLELTIQVCRGERVKSLDRGHEPDITSLTIVIATDLGL